MDEESAVGVGLQMDGLVEVPRRQRVDRDKREVAEVVALRREGIWLFGLQSALTRSAS
ncbi:hypothetical protein GCM10010528_17620 [Gordonia defluvii]|uniref:Transposase n=1 Tax=Gordonia defluvii TaxID=283718 RepID=A0ABP6LD00_9ACTN